MPNLGGGVIPVVIVLFDCAAAMHEFMSGKFPTWIGIA